MLFSHFFSQSDENPPNPIDSTTTTTTTAAVSNPAPSSRTLGLRNVEAESQQVIQHFLSQTLDDSDDDDDDDDVFIDSYTLNPARDNPRYSKTDKSEYVDMEDSDDDDDDDEERVMESTVGDCDSVTSKGLEWDDEI